MKTIAEYMTRAAVAVYDTDGTFPSKAAQKDALYNLSNAFDLLNNVKNKDALEAAGYNWTHLCLFLHQVKAKHEPIFTAAGIDWTVVAKLIEMRNDIRAMPVVKPAPKPVAKPTGNQATHQGTCQVCGCVHKVSNTSGKIATHGYTVDHGYFNGECGGGYELPFEVSCDYLTKHINDMVALIPTIDPNGFREYKDRYGRDRKVSNKAVIKSLQESVVYQTERLAGWTPKELIEVGA